MRELETIFRSSVEMRHSRIEISCDLKARVRMGRGPIEVHRQARKEARA